MSHLDPNDICVQYLKENKCSNLKKIKTSCFHFLRELGCQPTFLRKASECVYVFSFAGYKSIILSIQLHCEHGIQMHGANTQVENKKLISGEHL